ncbi:MAG TPA: short-chain dehydrogenase [Bacteroidetes bacterium]|nr:short-chain dehydrogenase [Bacteroidota bacterium]
MTKRTALITGASGGIGYELAELFAKDGYNLVLVARSTDTLKAIAEDFQSKYHIVAHIVPMNLSSADSPNELFHYLERNNITVDFLVNNAGFGMLGKFNEIELQDELDMIQLNITALTHLTKLFLKGMVARKFGRIMNVASTASFQPGPLMAVYYASKSYVLFLSEALAIELKGTGVTVSALCPGPTNTGFQSRAQMEKTKLFSDSGLVMNAKKVAAIGYKGMLKGKTVIIPGLANKILAQSIRFSPRKLSAEIVRFLQESK